MTESFPNSNLDSEDSFSNLVSDMGEDLVNAAMPLLTNQDFLAFNKKIDDLTFEVKQLKEGKRLTNEEDSVTFTKKIEELTLKQLKADKNIEELTFELKQLKEGKRVCFLNFPNRWKFIDSKYSCCKDKCVNINRPDAYCIDGNGFIQIKNDTNIIYINCRKERGEDKLARILSENMFNKPNENFASFQCCLNFTTLKLFYYEIKIKSEKKSAIGIGLKKDEIFFVSLWAANKSIYYYSQGKDKKINISSFSIKNGDVFGCGLVYSPPNINNKLPYVFFTQNGKQIGKSILLKDNFEYYQPYLDLKCCSVVTNFGAKPFLYDIFKHYLAEEFYKDEEFSDYKRNECEVNPFKFFY